MEIVSLGGLWVDGVCSFLVLVHMSTVVLLIRPLLRSARFEAPMRSHKRGGLSYRRAKQLIYSMLTCSIKVGLESGTGRRLENQLSKEILSRYSQRGQIPKNIFHGRLAQMRHPCLGAVYISIPMGPPGVCMLHAVAGVPGLVASWNFLMNSLSAQWIFR